MEKKTKQQRQQKRLKLEYKIHNWFSYAALVLLCLVVAMSLVAVFYFSIRKAQGIELGNQLKLSIQCFFVAVCGCAAMKLFDLGFEHYFKKDYEFNPANMELPVRGTVTLECALHKMAPKPRVIWDTFISICIGMLLLMLLFLGGNVPVIVAICLLLEVLLVAGHRFFTWRWEKRSFTKELLQNTEKYMRYAITPVYANSIEQSLKKGILYYAKEMIITEEFILGITRTDTIFTPVAIPRAEITEIAFYYRIPATSRYRKFEIGVLSCRLACESTVEFLIGQGARPQRVLKVLHYYQIFFIEKDTIYV